MAVAGTVAAGRAVVERPAGLGAMLGAIALGDATSPVEGVSVVVAVAVAVAVTLGVVFAVALAVALAVAGEVGADGERVAASSSGRAPAVSLHATNADSTPSQTRRRRFILACFIAVISSLECMSKRRTVSWSTRRGRRGRRRGRRRRRHRGSAPLHDDARRTEAEFTSHDVVRSREHARVASHADRAPDAHQQTATNMRAQERAASAAPPR